MPIARLIRLPIGSRLAAGSLPVAPSRTGLIAVPRLAPRTRAKAASGGTVPLRGEGHDHQHHGDAGMRRPGQSGREYHVQHRLGRDGAQQQTKARHVLIGNEKIEEAPAAPSASAQGR